MTATRHRILAISLELFNRDGERNTTTNHIADALAISPGNLYYHFRNKRDIIYQLFNQYRQHVEAFLVVPDDRPLTWEDKMTYLEAILQSIWEYRFLHRDLPHLMQQDTRLQADYRAFVSAALERGLAVYQGLRAAGLLEADDAALRALMVNTWVLVASWTGFVHSLVAETRQNQPLSQRLMRQGIYQIICLETPYLRNAALTHLDATKALYFQGNTFDLLFSQQEDAAQSA